MGVSVGPSGECGVTIRGNTVIVGGTSTVPAVRAVTPWELRKIALIYVEVDAPPTRRPRQGLLLCRCLIGVGPSRRR